MSDFFSSKLVRQMLRVHNPGESSLLVWLEPWSERFELTPKESLELVFVGPDTGSPEVLPRRDEVSVYGWAGSEFLAFKNGRLAGRQPTVKEIVLQELDIAKERVGIASDSFVADIAMLQQFLDAEPDLNATSQQSFCKYLSHFIDSLSPALEGQEAATEVLRQIASRLLRTKAIILAPPDPNAKEPATWKSDPTVAMELFLTRSVFVRPGDYSHGGVTETEKPSVTRQRAE